MLAARRFEAVPNDLNWLASLAGLSQAAVLLEDRARASQLYQLLAPYRSRAILVGRAAVCLGPAGLYLGMLAGIMGELDDALAHFDAASRWSMATGAELWAAWAQVYRARVLLHGSTLAGWADMPGGSSIVRADGDSDRRSHAPSDLDAPQGILSPADPHRPDTRVDPCHGPPNAVPRPPNGATHRATPTAPGRLVEDPQVHATRGGNPKCDR